MSRLIQNSTAAERAMGCIFAETFESNAALAENGGSLGGNAFIQAGGGLSMAAKTDYATFVVNSAQFAPTDTITYLIEFTPNFTFDSTTYYFMSNTTPDSKYYTQVDASNGLTSVAGGTGALFASSGGMSSGWTINKRSTIQVSLTSGSNQAYLNGVQVGTSATAWTGDEGITNLIAGASSAGINGMTGVMHSLKIFQQKLTAQDAVNHYNNSQGNYTERAIINYPMGIAEHDATNTQTLDRSGNGNNGNFGAGAAEPTKLADKHGYTLATADHFVGDGSKITSPEVSFVMEFTPDWNWDIDSSLYLLGTDDNSYRFYKTASSSGGASKLYMYLGGTLIDQLAVASYSPYWRQHRQNVFIITGDSVNNKTNVYLNGAHVLVDDPTAWTVGSPTNFHLGHVNTSTTGEYNSLEVYDFILSPTQVQDLTIRKQIEINNI